MANEITIAQMARVLSIDFVERFKEGLAPLLTILDIAEPTVLPAGSQVDRYTITGTLQSGAVAEAGEIPYSQYAEAKGDPITVELRQYRKGTTKQAILKSGYEHAVARTDEKFLNDIRATIRTAFFTFLADGTGTASGADLKATLAAAAGQLANATSTYGYEGTPVYFANPLDVYGYLGGASVYNVESAFGMQYVSNFLGLGTLLMDAKVPQGTVYATFRENIHAYAVDLSAERAAGFDFASDETGIIGVAHDAIYTHGMADTYADTGLTLVAEYLNLIVKASIVPVVDETTGSGD